MKKSTELSKKRNALKQEITELIENTFPARALHVTGAAIQKVTGLGNPPPWWVNAALLGLIVHIPATLVAILIKQSIWFFLFGILSDIAVVLFASLFYPMLKYILQGIHDHIIDNFEETQELDEFRSFLYRTQEHRKITIHTLIVSVIWLAIWIPSSVELMPGFTNWSFFLGVWSGGFFGIGIASYFLIWIMQLPNQLGKCRFKLYDLNPSQSEVVVHLSALFSRPSWILILLLAMGIAVGRLIEWPFRVLLAIQGSLWVLLIIQFINGRTAINKIITVKKWQTLSELQAQIHELKNKTNPGAPETIEKINNLMDLHERVYNAGNRRLTVTGALDFINQLILPLLAALIANYKDILEFFNK